MTMFPKDMIVIDTETSGTNDNASIIQLGAYIFDKKGFLTNNQFLIHIKPYTDEWSESAYRVHKINKDTLEKIGFKLNDALVLFEDWAKKKHNSLKNFHIVQWGCGFDTHLLQLAYKKINRQYPFHYRSFDVASLTRLYVAVKYQLSKKCGLGKCAEKLNIDVEYDKKHNALYDAYLTGKVFEEVIKRIKNDRIDRQTS